MLRQGNKPFVWPGPPIAVRSGKEEVLWLWSQLHLQAEFEKLSQVKTHAAAFSGALGNMSWMGGSTDAYECSLPTAGRKPFLI